MDKKELLSMLGGLYLQREELNARIDRLKIDLLLVQKEEQQKKPEKPQDAPD